MIKLMEEITKLSDALKRTIDEPAWAMLGKAEKTPLQPAGGLTQADIKEAYSTLEGEDHSDEDYKEHVRELNNQFYGGLV